MKKMYMFSYGMNTNTNEMAQRCPKSIDLGKSMLPKHRFRFAVHADVVEDVTSEVEGVLWEITDDCLSKIDRLEGYPYYYDRKIVNVITPDNKTYPAWVFYMQGDNINSPPHESYLSLVNNGYIQHNLNINQIKNALS